MRINIDDVGLHEDVNHAAIALISANKIDSISIMANGVAVHGLKNLPRNEIWINMHFCIVDGENAISADRLIVDCNKKFLTRNALFLKILSHPRHSLTLIESEANAQLKKLKELGFKVNGIDSHQHIHFFPPIFISILKFAKMNNLSIRILKFPFAYRRSESFLLMPIVYFDLLWAKMMKAKLHYAIGFEESGHLRQKRFNKYVARKSASELFAHPAISNLDLTSKYGHWEYDWYLEYQTLLNSDCGGR